MSLDIRWLVPVAIYAVAPQCIAAKYMNVDQARALIFPFADEYIFKPLQLTPAQMQEIDNITGATLSARHLTDGIRRLLFLHQSVLR